VVKEAHRKPKVRFILARGINIPLKLDICIDFDPHLWLKVAKMAFSATYAVPKGQKVLVFV